MSSHVLIAILTNYILRYLPGLAARPVLLALLIAVGPILLALSWQAAQKKARALTAKEQARVAKIIVREEYKVVPGEPSRPPG